MPGASGDFIFSALGCSLVKRETSQTPGPDMPLLSDSAGSVNSTRITNELGHKRGYFMKRRPVVTWGSEGEEWKKVWWRKKCKKANAMCWRSGAGQPPVGRLRTWPCSSSPLLLYTRLPGSLQPRGGGAHAEKITTRKEGEGKNIGIIYRRRVIPKIFQRSAGYHVTALVTSRRPEAADPAEAPDWGVGGVRGSCCTGTCSKHVVHGRDRDWSSRDADWLWLQCARGRNKAKGAAHTTLLHWLHNVDKDQWQVEGVTSTRNALQNKNINSKDDSNIN